MQKLDNMLDFDLQRASKTEKLVLVDDWVNGSIVATPTNTPKLAYVAYDLISTTPSLVGGLFKENYLRSLYNLSLESLRTLERNQENYASDFENLQAKLNFYVGFFAKLLFEMTGEKEIGETGFTSLRKSAKISSKFKPMKSAVAINMGADIAQRFFEKGSKIDSWGNNWYDGREQAALVVLEINPKYSGHSFGFAGHAAKEISRRSDRKRRTEWRSKGVDSYKRAIDILEEFKTEREVSGLIKMLTRELEFLSTFRQ